MAAKKAKEPRKPSRLGVRGYARYRTAKGLPVSHVAVLKKIKEGKLRESVSRDKNKNVWIKPEVADREWEQNSQALKQPGNVKGSEFAGMTTSQSHAVETYFKALLRQKDYLVEAGELVDAGTVRAAVKSANQKVKQLLLTIPERLGPAVAAEEDPDRATEMVKEEILQVLEALATI